MSDVILRSVSSLLMMAVWCSRWFWYHAVPVCVVLWATYIVHTYRVLGNPIFALLPVVGAIMTGLWAIFVIDEFVDVLQGNARLARVVGYVSADVHVRRIRWKPKHAFRPT